MAWPPVVTRAFPVNSQDGEIPAWGAEPGGPTRAPQAEARTTTAERIGYRLTLAPAE
jgi:hypothetical protein